MARVGSVALLALLVAACAPTSQERVQQYNDAGVRLFHQGEYDHAREEFQAALRWSPNDPSLLYNLGQCYDLLGQADRAEQIYRACLQQDPDQADCRHALDVLLVQRGRIVEAQQMVQDWLSHNPKLAAAYAEDGWLYRQEGD
ncbi:MAG TPA: tetratricopeptide repeat protein, partial [Gemmataceae bacterium]